MNDQLDLLAQLLDPDWNQRREALLRIDRLKAPLSPEELAVGRAIALEALGHTKSQIRHAAVWALAKVGDQSAVGPLANALSDENTSIRWGAAVALRDLKLTGAEEDLVKTLNDNDHSVAFAVQKALENTLSPSAVVPLINLLKTADSAKRWYRRSDIYELLGKIADPRAVDVLIWAMIWDSNSLDRSEASSALGLIKDNKTIESLSLVLTEKDGGHKIDLKSVAWIFNTIDPLAGVNALVKVLEENPVHVKCRAIYVLGYMGASIVKDKLEALQHSDEPVVAGAAIWALTRLLEADLRKSKKTAIEITPFLENLDTGVVLAAIESLAASGSPSVIDRLLPFLESPERGIRKAIVSALADIGDERSADVLFNFLERRDIDSYERLFAAKALIKLANPSLLERFVNAIKNERDSNVVNKLISGLKSINHPESAQLAFELSRKLVHPACLETEIKDEEANPVVLGASKPKAVEPGESFTVTFVAYAPELESAVVSQLAGLSPRSESHLGLKHCCWRMGTEVIVELVAYNLLIEEPQQNFNWDGHKEFVFWDIRVPDDATPSTIVLKINAYISGVRIAKLRMDLDISLNGNAEKQTVSGISAAVSGFASYAVSDRPRVLDMVEAIEISTGINVFIDCMDIKAGEAWWPRIEQEILKRDLFLLFWSSKSRSSEWVDREWRKAYSSKLEEDFQIFPLDPPAIAPPPEELAHLHFGDIHALVRRGISD